LSSRLVAVLRTRNFHTPEAEAAHVPRSGNHYDSRGWSVAEPTDQRNIEPKPRSGGTGGALIMAGGL
jgi:hypothetical protein